MIENLFTTAFKNIEWLKELKEPSIKNIKEASPIQSSMDVIDNTSLESLKAKNEIIAEKISAEKVEPIKKNREAGANREELAKKELQQKFPEKEGYKIEREMYLRNAEGNIVKDPVTGEARRIDFVVNKDGKIVKSIEVTSKTAPKEAQLAKEERIREAGGNYIKTRDTGRLIEFPKDIKTEVRRYI